MRTHYVYEAYDADGLLLYVGCTGNLPQRLRAHMGKSEDRGWFNRFVTDWRASGPYEPAVAFRVEKERIDAYQPIWNGHSKENLLGRRALVNAYLAFHGLRFEDYRDADGCVRSRVVRVRRHLTAVA